MTDAQPSQTPTAPETAQDDGARRGVIVAGLAWTAIILALHLFDALRQPLVEFNRGWTADLGPVRLLVTYVLNGLTGLAIGFLPFVVIELFSTRAADRPGLLRRMALPLLIWLAYYLLSCLSFGLSLTFRKLTGIQGFDTFSGLPVLWQIVVYIVLLDFMGYWFHRLEHRNRFLWQFHSTHHSLENLSAVNSYSHWFESMFRFFIVLLPVSIVMQVPDTTGSSLALIWAVWTTYVHSDAPVLQMPSWLRRVFVDNLFHHYHHGKAAEFRDVNFGGQFSLWDWMFGTAKWPESDAFPETGLSYLRPPQSVWQFLVHPFVRPK